MIVVTPERYLALLNRQLARHADYEFGMRFVLRPTGGFDWEPKGCLQPFCDVSRAVRQHYVVIWRSHPYPPVPASSVGPAGHQREPVGIAECFAFRWQ